MKSLQIASGIGSVALLILTPLETDYDFKLDLLSFLFLTAITFIVSSHYVGIQNKSNNEER